MKTNSITMDITQARQAAIARINTLPLPKLVQAIDFMDFLKARALVDIPPVVSTPSVPAPDAFVECAGTWQFEPGELEEILQFIEKMRLMEIEEQDERVFTRY